MSTSFLERLYEVTRVFSTKIPNINASVSQFQADILRGSREIPNIPLKIDSDSKLSNRTLQDLMRYESKFLRGFSDTLSEGFRNPIKTSLDVLDRFSQVYNAGNWSRTLKDLFPDNRAKAIIEIIETLIDLVLETEEELKQNRKIIYSGISRYNNSLSSSQESIDKFASYYIKTMMSFDTARGDAVEKLNSYVESGGNLQNLISDYIREPKLSSFFLNSVASASIALGSSVDDIFGLLGKYHHEFGGNTKSQVTYLHRINSFSRNLKLPFSKLTEFLDQTANSSVIYGSHIKNSLALLSLMRRVSRSSYVAVVNASSYNKNSNEEIIELGLMRLLSGKSDFRVKFLDKVFASVSEELKGFSGSDINTAEYVILKKLSDKIKGVDYSSLDAELFYLLKDYIKLDHSFLLITETVNSTFGGNINSLLQAASLYGIDPKNLLFFKHKASEKSKNLFDLLNNDGQDSQPDIATIESTRGIASNLKTLSDRVREIISQTRFDLLSPYVSEVSKMASDFLMRVNTFLMGGERLAIPDVDMNRKYVKTGEIFPAISPGLIVGESSVSFEDTKKEIMMGNFDAGGINVGSLETPTMVPDKGSVPSPPEINGKLNDLSKVTEKSKGKIDSIPVRPRSNSGLIIFDKTPATLEDIRRRSLYNQQKEVFSNGS